MLRVNCPACRREFESADFLGGLTAFCRNCGAEVVGLPLDGMAAVRV